MNEQDIAVVEMMEARGGSFVKALAALCYRADHINLELIKKTWPKYWHDYEEMAKAE